MCTIALQRGAIPAERKQPKQTQSGYAPTAPSLRIGSQTVLTAGALALDGNLSDKRPREEGACPASRRCRSASTRTWVARSEARSDSQRTRTGSYHKRGVKRLSSDPPVDAAGEVEENGREQLRGGYCAKSRKICWKKFAISA